MKNIIFQSVQRDDYGELTEWLVRMSQTPEQHCLHSWSGERAEELRRQLVSYCDDSELCYVVARQDGHLVGAMGSEYDEDLGRGWLHGPHAALNNSDADAIMAELFKRLLEQLPSGIRQFDAYLNVENIRGRRFYKDQLFKEREYLSHVLWLTRDTRSVSGDTGCMPLEKEHEASFKQIYKRLFPSAYYNADRVIEMIGQHYQIFVTTEGYDVLGFVVVSAEGRQSSGEIHFFGVHEDHRRQGYGRRLLLTAIDWLFDSAEASQICLNVGEELAQARDLYERVGFRLRFSGIGLRKTSAKY